jgi:hypothetical protein
MKKIAPFLLLFSILTSVMVAEPASASATSVKMEMMGKKKKFKGYKKPKSKKFLGIFKRKSDCGCPNH